MLSSWVVHLGGETSSFSHTCRFRLQFFTGRHGACEFPYAAESELLDDSEALVFIVAASLRDCTAFWDHFEGLSFLQACLGRPREPEEGTRPFQVRC